MPIRGIGSLQPPLRLNFLSLIKHMWRCIMKRSILLIMALLLFLPGLSHGELISEDFCFYCPPGSVLQLPDAATDRYYCMIPGTPRSVAVPLWAKPVWSRITSTGCPANYFPRGDGINCYKCPLTYEFTSAITDYRRTPDWIIAPLASGSPHFCASGGILSGVGGDGKSYSARWEGPGTIETIPYQYKGVPFFHFRLNGKDWPNSSWGVSQETWKVTCDPVGTR